MAWNILGLCILVLGAAGIINASVLDLDNSVESLQRIPPEERWNHDKQLSQYFHYRYPHSWRHNYRNIPWVERKIQPLDYKRYYRKSVVIRKPPVLSEVKFPEDSSRFKKLTATQAVESNENSILASDTYDYEPENLIGCNKTECIEKLQVASSETGKNETEEKNFTSLYSSFSTILPNTSESSSLQKDSESTYSSESNQNTTPINTTISDTLTVTENTTNEEISNKSSYFSTESTILSTQTSKKSGDEDGSANSSATITSTQTLDNSTDEDISVSVSDSNNGTTFPTQTSEKSTSDDGSADASVSHSTTVSVENGTDEVTVTSHASTTKAPSSADVSSTETEENLTTNPEITSDASSPSTTISEEKETTESISSQTEFNSSTAAQSTSSQSPEEKSLASVSISSTTDKGSFASSTSVDVEKTTVDISPSISSKDSTSSKSEITTQAISEDHNIKISSIRTARMIVTVVFLVILLIAVTILAVYVFKAKRRAVEYDQLVLLP